MNQEHNGNGNRSAALRQNLARAENPFAAPATTEKTTAGAGMLESHAAATVQGMVVMSKRFPRDPEAAVERILDACTRTKLAEAAEYAYPRGGQTVTGPSIRLAEVVAQNWGNLEFGTVELSQEGGRSHMMAFAWDLETNVRQHKIFVVEHVRKARGQLHALTDPREIYELTANQGARRVRACILGVIPGDVIETAVNQCRLTVRNSMAAPEEEIEKIIAAFGEKFGVPEVAVRKRLGGKRSSAVTAAEVIRMRQIYRSLLDNMSKPEEWFDMNDAEEAPRGKGKGQPEKTAPRRSEALKKRVQEQTEPEGNGADGEEAGRFAFDPSNPPVDADGVEFDPEFHVADKATGRPVINKDGSFRKRPRPPIETGGGGDDPDGELL